MELDNAYIAFHKQTGGGYDENRNPIPPADEVSAYVPCNLQQIKRDYRMLVDGQYVQAKYSIYIKPSEMPDGYDANALTMCRLKNLDGVVLGDFIVHSNEPLSLFKKNKLILRDVSAQE